MGRCSDKIKHTCGDSLKAECVDYEGNVNSQSELLNDSCLSVEDTTQDIYNQLEEIDVSDINNECLEYDENEKGKIEIKTVVKKHGDEICSIKETIDTIKSEAFLDLNIANSGLNFLCLETECETSIQTVRDWIQAVTNRLCD